MGKCRFLVVFFFFPHPVSFLHSVFIAFAFLGFLMTDKRLWAYNRLPKRFWKKFKSGLWHLDPAMTNVSGRPVLHKRSAWVSLFTSQ